MPRETLLAHRMVQLADSLVEDFDIVDLLSILADSCVEVLDAAAAGVMLVSPAGDLRVVASSSEAMMLLELFEVQGAEGPCVECARTGRAVINQNLADAEDRWPHFAPRAVGAGFESVHALPLRLRDQVIGALNIYRRTQRPLTDADVAAAQALADVAVIAILQHRSALDGPRLDQQLTDALQARVVIERAKGIVSESAGVDVDAAFTRLRRHARNHDLRLTDVADAVSAQALPVAALDD